MENIKTPTAIILSRQNITDLPTDKHNAQCGAYVVYSDENPDVVLLASGSEVSTLNEAAALLRNDGIRVRLVSVPSEGLFTEQTHEYRQSVLPDNIKRFGLTAGLPVNLEGLVGSNGTVFGLDHFGYSAPYTVLDEKFGFTADNIYREVKKIL